MVGPNASVLPSHVDHFRKPSFEIPISSSIDDPKNVIIAKSSYLLMLSLEESVVLSRLVSVPEDILNLKRGISFSSSLLSERRSSNGMFSLSAFFWKYTEQFFY